MRPTGRSTAILGIAIAGCLLLAASASASTLKIDGDNTTISYDGVAGEANALTITRSGDNFVFTDAPAIVVTPTAPCTAVANVGSCPATGITDLDVNLDDLDDSASYDNTVVISGTAHLRGEGGGDALTAGDNSESWLNGDNGANTITGGASIDRLDGGTDVDSLIGGAGDDLIIAGGGADVVSGGPGADRLFDGASAADGADSFDGGAGLGDSLDLRSRTESLSASLDGVGNDGESGEGDNYISVERIDLGEGDDVAVGDDSPNVFFGNQGNDNLSGAGGNDGLIDFEGDDVHQGGPGADTLFPGIGSDRAEGGDGDDVFVDNVLDDSIDTYLGGAGTDLFGAAGEGIPSISPGVAISLDGVANDGPLPVEVGQPLDNVGADIENVAGGPGADTLVGNESPNEIEAGRGDDTILGLGGADALIGADGNDTIDAGTGIDLIDAGGGVDTLRSRDSDPDDVSCGSSADTLLADAFDPFPASCDDASLGAFIAKRKVELNEDGKGKLRVSCPAAERTDCDVRVDVGKGRKTLATAKGRVNSGKTEKVRLKLTRAGEKILAEEKKFAAPAATTMTDATGSPATTSIKKLVVTP